MEHINLSSLSIQELASLEEQAYNERNNRLKAEEDIKYIEFKTKYEHQWVKSNYYDEECIRYIISVKGKEVECLSIFYGYDSFIVEICYTSVWDIEDDYVLAGADTVGNFISNFKNLMDDFIDDVLNKYNTVEEDE